MVVVFVVMFVILALCGLVVAYAAYPHRGTPMPGVPWLGRAMEAATDAVPMVDDEARDQGPSISLR